MSKRYREGVEIVRTRTDGRTPEGVAPVAFRWRGTLHTVTSVLGHWREDAGWWAARGTRVPQRDLWRVEVRSAGARHPTVCELACEDQRWRLDRVWD
ncbi:MAG: DUF6504 family protein [Egibacteraceae bacterium]